MDEAPSVSAHTGPSWSDEYHSLLGHFHGTWATIDLVTDYAICKYLGVTPENTHHIWHDVWREITAVGGADE